MWEIIALIATLLVMRELSGHLAFRRELRRAQIKKDLINAYLVADEHQRPVLAKALLGTLTPKEIRQLPAPNTKEDAEHE
jgi:hypothetical protein